MEVCKMLSILEKDKSDCHSSKKSFTIKLISLVNSDCQMIKIQLYIVQHIKKSNSVIK